MLSVHGTYLLKLVLLFINFCDTYYRGITSKANDFVNDKLDGYVIFYAFYSIEEKYCAVLYDYRSFLKRLYLVLYNLYLQVVHQKNLSDTSLIFKHESVVDNVDNLSSFFVDCAIVSYIQDKVMHHDIIGNQTRNDVSPTSFVYVVLDDGFGEHDFTKAFNRYARGISQSQNLTCKDIMTIMCKVENRDYDLSNFTLKCMMDITYDEIVFKEMDIISSKISS